MEISGALGQVSVIPSTKKNTLSPLKMKCSLEKATLTIHRKGQIK